MASLLQQGFASPEYVAQSQDHSWKLRRSGCFVPSVEVVDAATGAQVAHWRSEFGSDDTLTFVDGQTFRIASRGLWHPVWTVLDDKDQPVLTLLSRDRKVTMQHSSLSDERRALLAIVAWHAKKQAENDAAILAMLAAT